MQKNTAVWLSAIEPKVNLKPQLSLDSFNHVNKMALKVKNKLVKNDQLKQFKCSISSLITNFSFSQTGDGNWKKIIKK